MKITQTIKITIGVVAALILSLILTTGTAQAQEPDGGEFGSQALEIRYQQAGLAVQIFQLRIRMANLAADKVQVLIDKAASAGKDTSALVSALSVFKTQIGEAQSAHDAAAATLANHSGFDENGKVTNVETARATLKSLRETLRSGRQALREGTRDFRQAFRDWRKVNKPQGQPSAP